MFVPLQPVRFNVILDSVASALIIWHSTRGKRFLRCNAAVEEKVYKKDHLTCTDVVKQSSDPAAGFRGEHDRLLDVVSPASPAIAAAEVVN